MLLCFVRAVDTAEARISYALCRSYVGVWAMRSSRGSHSEKRLLVRLIGDESVYYHKLPARASVRACSLQSARGT